MHLVLSQWHDRRLEGSRKSFVIVGVRYALPRSGPVEGRLRKINVNNIMHIHYVGHETPMAHGQLRRVKLV